MKTIAKRIGIKVYNLKNGPFWKQGGAIVERQGHNIVLDCVKIRSHGKNNRVIIEDGVRLHHVKIQISGNDNTIIIGRNCSIQDTIFAMEEDHNSVILGAGQPLREALFFQQLKEVR